VPEVAVDEDGNLRSTEYDVGPTGQSLDMLSIPEATPMQQTTDGQLGLGVTAPDP
jgi:hypothetical protein